MKWGALFPGQGSQSVGMGKFLFDEFQTARHLFEEAGDALKQDMRKLCFEGPESELQLTENTQPALVLVSTVTSRVALETTGIQIEAASGHSVGEYSALVQAGVLSFSDALLAVRARGRSMQKAVPVGEGGMCAVLGLQDEIVRQLCKEVEAASGFALEPANFNSPGQVVVSGSAKAIAWMRENVKPEWMTEKFGAEVGKPKFIPLAVSAPFHCRLMKPAEEEMTVVLEGTTFSPPRFPVIQNLTASSANSPDEIRQKLIGQISGAVLWTQCQQELLARGISKYVEFGAGRVLQGLAKKIAGDQAQVFGLNSIADLKTLEAATKPRLGDEMDKVTTKNLEPSAKRLVGRRIVVTGSSRGIGAGIAKWLAAEGAQVVVTYSSNEAAAQEVVKSMPGSGHLCLPLNVSDESSVEAFFTKVQETGGMHSLVNNAGIEKDQLILRMKSEEFDAVIGTNLRGTFLCSRAAIKMMFKTKVPGSIVNITSVIGEMGNAGQSNYAASKAGVEGMTKSLAKEVASRAIRLNCVAPGFVDTDMTRKMTDDQKAKILSGVPMGHMATTEDIAAATAFLLSDEARYITGQTLSVNGGLYI